MQTGWPARNLDLLAKLVFVGGIFMMIVVLLQHDPFAAALGFLMVGLPAIQWYVASPHSRKLGRYRTPLLATIWFAMMAGLLALHVWWIRRAISYFAS